MGWVEHKLKLNKAFLNPKSSKMNKISKKVKFLVQINEVLKGHFQNPKPDKFWKPNASLYYTYIGSVCIGKKLHLTCKKFEKYEITTA